MSDEAMESYDGLSDRAGSDQEKRMRREIANSNERRRMQSINAGFQSLRTLLPHHEGEKLSKAAILQQTAEYIYTLEQEKTRLLSQNCQLKRIINQHEGEASTTSKKRKLDSGPVTVVPAPISESSDEGIGSMSPEPVSMSATGGTTVPSAEQDSASELLRRELIDLRQHLERERRIRLLLEDQVKSLESQLYPDRAQLQYQHEVASWPEDPPLEEDLYPDLKQEAELPHTVLHPPISERDGPPPRRESQCSTHSNRGLFKDEVDGLPAIQPSAIVAAPTIMFTSEPEGPPLPPLAMPVSASPCPSPVQTTLLETVLPALEPRLPTVLEAAIKAEPKVEVERLPSPSSVTDENSQARLYINTSRQNLETIVEAIRHLEGDHLFSDDPSPHRQTIQPTPVAPLPTELPSSQEILHERLQGCLENDAQEMPLALTTSSRALPQQCGDPRILKMKLDPFSYQRTALQQQQRPGVIVVKHT
ncbi:helix-loop-helix protein 11 isoform X2 [Frankliniella occidentalis]|uniref:Helix-loop-helix protein 11 isoform X2 n=1 Tax=Frankliniella occidentalis TaxID=133901 RepID=A0A6J1S1X5_FRAOC|nr:helix-loop-helix protein 11 isoform X2 [Frankliniella occidentalis]